MRDGMDLGKRFSFLRPCVRFFGGVKMPHLGKVEAEVKAKENQSQSSSTLTST